MIRPIRLLAAALGVALLMGCGSPTISSLPTGTADRPPWAHDVVRFLGPADALDEAGLLDAMLRRGSVRDLSSAPLTEAELAALFWSAQGVSTESGARTVPSAGALYPLEMYAVTPDGVMNYVPRTASVHLRSDPEAKGRMADTISDTPASAAYAIIVITAVPFRVTAKYGERGIPYLWMEAGHAAQNMLLAAAALGLGAVTIGAFNDAGVAATLGLSDQEFPLYVIPVGRPISR